MWFPPREVTSLFVCPFCDGVLATAREMVDHLDPIAEPEAGCVIGRYEWLKRGYRAGAMRAAMRESR